MNTHILSIPNRIFKSSIHNFYVIYNVRNLMLQCYLVRTEREREKKISKNSQFGKGLTLELVNI